MSAAKTLVVHMVAADVSVGKLGVLRALLARDQPAVRQVLVHVGRGRLRAAGLPRPVNVRAGSDLAWLTRRALSRVLDRLAPVDQAGPVLLQVWSPTALVWSGALARPDRKLVIETELGPEVRRVARWLATQPTLTTVAVVCPTALTRRRLLYFGVPRERCALIRESVDLAEIDRARVAQLRARLELATDQTAVVMLPPIARQAGSFVAAWAAMVLEKARPDVRLVVPAGDRGHVSVRRLVYSCRHERMVRFVDAEVSLAELAALADLAVFLPTGDAPPSGLPWAMAAGQPIVASAVPAVTEFLAHGRNAWLCRPGDPRAAASRMLQALEQSEESRRQAQRAWSQARELFNRGRMLAQYAGLYADLSAGRDIADDPSGA